MGEIKSFEDLVVWNRSQQLYIRIFNLFVDTKQYHFQNQICRAALSVSNNIAEGHDRGSRKDYCRFLIIAKASCSEVRSMLYLAKSIYPKKNADCDMLINDSHEIGKMIYRMVEKLK